MPTPLANNSIILVSALYSQNGQRLINTIHYKYEEAAPAADYRVIMNEIIDAMQVAGAIEDDIGASMHNSVTLDQWVAQPVYPVRLSAVKRTRNRAGARGGTALPQNTSAVITRVSDEAARWGRSSWHAVGLVISDNNNGSISAGYAILLDQLGDSITSDYTLAGGHEIKPVIWNRAVPARVTEIVTWNVETTMRVMRRRTVQVGI